MRKIIQILCVILVISFGLAISGCGKLTQREEAMEHSSLTGGEDASLQPGGKIEDAKRVEQILDRLNWCNDLDLPVYSELDDYEAYLGYFDLLQTYDFNYLLFNIDGSQYLFMMYRFTNTIENLDGLKKVNQTFTGDKLNLFFVPEAHAMDGNKGCFPQAEHVRCILKVDDSFDPDKCTVYAEGYGQPVIEKYQGGIVRADDKYGFVDKDLNIKHKIAHSHINDFETDRVDGYYWMVDDGIMGLLDHYGNMVLSQSYTSIVCINRDRFIVERKDATNNHSIGLVDSHENIIHDFIPGQIEMQRVGIYNVPGQFEFSRNFLKGVIDENLNIVIEPKYYEIAHYYEDTPQMFYAVRNEKRKCAVIGNDGELKTDFDYDELYDAYQVYFESKGGYRSGFFSKSSCRCILSGSCSFAASVVQ